MVVEPASKHKIWDVSHNHELHAGTQRRPEPEKEASLWAEYKKNL